jgi:hypothetical protein
VETYNTDSVIPLATVSGDKEKYYLFCGTYSNQEFIRIEIGGDALREKIKTYSEDNQKKDEYYITAIRNLLKQINFLELYQSLIQGDITEEDFENIINAESNRYTIDIHDMKNPKEDIQIILSIVKNIGFDIKDFSQSEIDELFSVNVSKNISMYNKVGVEK